MCGLRDGKVVCWGYDHFKAVGVEPPHKCSTLGCAPSPCALGLDATAVSAGQNTTCMITPSGSVSCWGEGNVGQLGEDPTEICGDDMNAWPCTAQPRAIEGLRDVTAVAAGTHVCALTKAGIVWCWGNNHAGQLGAETKQQCVPNLGKRPYRGRTQIDLPHESLACSRAPIRVPVEHVTQIAVGGSTSYAVKQGHVYCWGDNEWGQCPGGGGIAVTKIAGLANIAGVAAGVNYACAWSQGGKAWCWGASSSGHLGKGPMEKCLGDFECGRTPREIAISEVVEISAGFMHACARKRDGSVACWGLERKHLLGFKATDGCGPTQEACEREPKLVPGIAAATAVSVGTTTTCVIVEGRVKCWGLGNLGGLGDGATSDRSEARAIEAPRSCR